MQVPTVPLSSVKSFTARFTSAGLSVCEAPLPPTFLPIDQCKVKRAMLLAGV